jgi:hypothetical protein
MMASRPSDGERDRTGASGGERATGAGGVSVVIEGDRESSSLGDGMSLSDGNANLQGLDIATDTNPGCAIGPTSVEPLEETGTIAGRPTTFMAIDRVAMVGAEERAFPQWKVEW